MLWLCSIVKIFNIIWVFLIPTLNAQLMIMLKCSTPLYKIFKLVGIPLIMKNQEEVFWPTQKRHRAFIKMKRKSSKDPMTFLSELRKKTKFCQVTEIVNAQQCNHCNWIIEIPEDSEKAIKKLIILVFFNGLEDNNFAGYLTNELKRSGKNATFEEINRLYLQ